MEGGDSKEDGGGGGGGSGEAIGGRIGTTGGITGAGGGVRGRFPGPDLAAGVLGAGVLGSEFGTTLLITLVMDGDKHKLVLVCTVWKISLDTK